MADSKIIRVKSLKEQVYCILKDGILNHEYADNQVLNERVLSEELNVSRTPIREALKALESEGWVEYVPYKGVVVKRVGLKEHIEIIQVRNALEVLMIELVMPHITEELLCTLQGIVDRQAVCAASPDPDKKLFSLLDIEFHEALATANPNDTLKDLLAGLRDRIRRFAMSHLIWDHNRYSETFKEHNHILQMLKARDKAGAIRAMKQHLKNLQQTSYLYLSREEASDEPGQ